MDLTGRIALVTGGARRLGKTIALALAREGAHAAVHYGGSSEAAEETAREIEALGVESCPIQADLRSSEEVEALFERLKERFGRLDVLVNSAASFERESFDRISASAWDDVMALNLRAPFLCTQQAARLMRHPESDEDRSDGVIVNISDLSAWRPWKGYAHHGVSKAALIHFTHSAALELAPGIRVNCVVPGAILPPPGVSTGSEEWLRRGEKVPLRRTGEGERVAEAILSLVRNDYITGAVLPIDGGEHLM